MITFVMSSNLLVYVGFVVADRTLYLPSYGSICGLTVLLFVVPHSIFRSKAKTEAKSEPSEPLKKETGSTTETQKVTTSDSTSGGKYHITFGLAAIVLSAYTAKQLAQTARWADPVELWGEAYRLYPNSCINGGELGMSLTNAQRPLDAVPVSWRD
jgi:hypothetical protein